MKNKLFLSQIDKIKAIYITGLILHVMISQIFPLSLTDFELARGGMGLLLMLIGILIICYEFFSNTTSFFNKNNPILICYFTISIVSCIWNYEYGYVNNVKSLAWTSIHFFVLCSFLKGYLKKEKIYLNIFVLPIIVWDFSTIYSLGQFLFQISKNINGTAQGWYYNRLFGVYKDPNFATIASICVVFMAVFSAKNVKQNYQKSFYYLSVFIQVTYILLAHSRGGWLAGAISVFVYFIFSANRKKIKTKIGKATLCTLVLLTSLSIYKNILPSFPNVVESFKVKEDITINISTTSPNSANKKISLERSDLENKDFSNGRLNRWKLALLAFPEHPLIGISPQNLEQYYKVNHPDIINHTDFGDFHNGYIAVLVGTGSIGFCLIGIYIFTNIKKFIKVMVYTLDINYNAAFAAIVTCVAIGGMIIQEIFWINSVGTILFWISIGALEIRGTLNEKNRNYNNT